MFRTGHGMYKTQHYINGEGVNNVFATNVLGHFTLVMSLFVKDLCNEMLVELKPSLDCAVDKYI